MDGELRGCMNDRRHTKSSVRGCFGNVFLAASSCWSYSWWACSCCSPLAEEQTVAAESQLLLSKPFPFFYCLISPWQRLREEIEKLWASKMSYHRCSITGWTICFTNILLNIAVHLIDIYIGRCRSTVPICNVVLPFFSNTLMQVTTINTQPIRTNKKQIHILNRVDVILR